MGKRIHNPLQKWRALVTGTLLLLGLQATGQSVVWTQTREGSTTRVQLTLPPPQWKSVETWQLPVLEEGVSWAQAGEPDLPEVAYKIAIEDKEGATLLSVSFEEETTLANIQIAPAAEERMVGQPPKARACGAVYTQDALFPQQRVELSPPYYTHGGWYQTIYVRPYAYHPLRGEFLHSKAVTLRLKGLRSERRQTQQTRQGVLATEENGALLIVTPAKYLPQLAPLVQWKRDKGLTVELLLFGETSGETPYVRDTTALKGYLQTRYAQTTPPLKYLLLVGNRGELPPLRRRGATRIADSDQAYGQLVGDDSRNEVYVGRFPAYSPEQVTVQVNRVLYYEREMTEANVRLNYGLCISSNEGWGIGDNDETDYEHSEGLRRVLLQRGYKEVAFLFDRDLKKLSVDTVAATIGRGVGVINYVGHGYSTRWTTSGYSVNDVYALTQTEAHPVIFDVACSNGNMEVSPCFAEAWMWSEHKQKPSGAIGLCASSEEQYWDAPMRGQDRMNDYFTKSSDFPYVVTLGGIISSGINDMLVRYRDVPGSRGRATAVTWNIFGDPSLVLRSRAPESLHVSHTPEVYSSETSFEVTCETDGVEAVLRLNYASGEVTYQKEVVRGGKARFEGLTLAGCSGGHLTVWGLNKATYSADIPCIEGTPSPLRIIGLRLAPIEVNQEGSVCAGDQWQILCNVVYSGAELPYKGLKASIDVSSKLLTVTDLLKDVRPFTTNEAVEWWVATLRVSPNTPNQTPLSFVLRLTREGQEVARRTYTTTVLGVDMKLKTPQSTSTFVAEAGKRFDVASVLENRGALDFKKGVLYYSWSVPETPTITQELPVIRRNTAVTVTQQLTIPDALKPFEEVTLTVKLRDQLSNLAQQHVLRFVGGLPYSLGKTWESAMPFIRGTSEPKEEKNLESRLLQETLYDFGDPVQDGAYPRILGVRLPIATSEKRLVVRGLYADILSLAEREQHLTAPFEMLGGRGRETLLKVENNYITIPLHKPFDYDERTMHDLTLRIQSEECEETLPYFILSQQTQSEKTLVRKFYYWEEEDTEREDYASLPLLRFVFAESVPFHFVVVDERGLPVKDAEVDVNEYVRRTDARGTVTIDYLEGDYRVAVFSPHHGTQYFPLRLRKETPEVQIVLTRGKVQPLTCLLTDQESGTPIAHGEVIYEGQHYTTDAEGKVDIEVRGGIRELRGFAEGYHGASVRAKITDQTAVVRIALSPRTPERTFEVSCSPNPVADVLRVTSGSLMTKLVIYDVMGVVVAQEAWYGYAYEVSLRHLPRGLYFVEVWGAEGHGSSRRMIVKD